MNKVKDVSKEISALMVEIAEKYNKAYPEGRYLTFSYVNGHVSANNEYWGNDADFQIQIWIDLNEDDEHEY